jgi:magnesium chelatase family protein
MVSRILSCTVIGLTAVPVHVELDITSGLPGLTIVGMGDTAIRESRERVVAALRNSGYELPPARITVNLAPADLRKEGSRFDLPIALGILATLRAFPSAALEGFLVMGELSLTGEVVGREPAFPAALLARKAGLLGMILSKEMASEASLVNESRPLPVNTLSETAEFLRGRKVLDEVIRPVVRKPDKQPDLSDVSGQAVAKRALEIAAAGGHNILFMGPPGSGKTMLARRLPGILPRLDMEESMEVSAIHSIAGLLSPAEGLIDTPPFRAPHHTISHVGLAGGGNSPKPGEITLAHRGILFLDEMSEFRRSALETLRQPLEDRRIVISRASRSVSFPADFLLAGTTNPCPCGFLGHETRPCTCSPSAVSKYRRRISGPLMDRIDIVVQVRALEPGTMIDNVEGEASGTVSRRVLACRTVQSSRAPGGIPTLNGRLNPDKLKQLCPLSTDHRQLLEGAMKNLSLTARGYHRVLRVGRTIADLEGEEYPAPEHLAEALQYRPVLESPITGF